VVDVNRDGFLQTMDVSCWSFLRMAHLAEPLMKNGGALFTMTYYGSQMVVQNYNIMGVAKAALEAAVRYAAAELGPKGIRVHAISPGPLATRAASGIPEFDELMDKAQSKAPSRIMQRNQLGNTGRALAAFDLDHEMVVHAQPVGGNVLGFRNGDPAAQPRAGRDRREIADAIGAVVERVPQVLQPDHGPNEQWCKRQREQAVRDGATAGHFLLRALLVDVDPLLVAGSFCKLIDALLCHLYPVTGADLGANSGFDRGEVAEYAHIRSSD
jgi:NAD(P)-dependent dehydrogenase (short-subunit alcohol dehydrogenase family)